MKPKHERAIARYELKCQEAQAQLIAKIEPDLHKACRKWGLDFVVGSGDWAIRFAKGYSPFGREGTRVLMRFMEPDLTEVLDKSLNGYSPIGSMLNKFVSNISDHDWVVLHARHFGTEPIDMLGQRDCPLSFKTGYVHFGWISEQLALAILKAYSNDMEIGRALIRALPRCLTSETLIYPADKST